LTFRFETVKIFYRFYFIKEDLMAKPKDLGNATVRDILESKIGKDAADRVVKKLNDAQEQGKGGDELKKCFKDAMSKEGHDITAEDSGILYGFYVP
jgi:hypothetical protein